MRLKDFVKNFFKIFNIAIVRHSKFQKNISATRELEILQKRYIFATRDLEILQKLNGTNSKELLQYLGKSKSQLRQDLFVLSQLGFKKNGFFVEFGATNGLDLSNSHLLEKEFGWNGILAEPAAFWHKELKKNRVCNIETDCVWKDSKSVLVFNQADQAELSTIDSFSDCDLHSNSRQKGKSYKVRTISLNDLLKKYNAPKVIDYLSIDTEGSEYQILSHFNFSEYSFKIITCEHNFSPMREKIFSLLTQQGYQRVFMELSWFDDWYIKPSSSKD
jgi:FkbM family methyltransferase